MQCATLYVMDPSLIGSKILDSLPQVLSYSHKSDDNGNATGMVLKLDIAEIDMNFMTSFELEEHLEGLKGFASMHACEGVDSVYALSRVAFVKIAIGCNISPGFDDDGKVLRFLQNLNKAYNSLLFYDSKLFDYDMEILAGL